MENYLIQITSSDLKRIITEAIQETNQTIHEPPKQEPPIKGIHELAKFLRVSPARAQKLKNEGVIPYFQNNRLVLFDPSKVREAMMNYHKKSNTGK